MSVNIKEDGQLVRLAGLFAIGSPGLFPKFIIESTAGDTLTVSTPGGGSITPTQVSGSTTEWECDVPDYGTYSVISTIAGYSTNVNVNKAKVYNILFE